MCFMYIIAWYTLITKKLSFLVFYWIPQNTQGVRDNPKVRSQFDLSSNSMVLNTAVGLLIILCMYMHLLLF